MIKLDSLWCVFVVVILLIDDEFGVLIVFVE